MFACMAPLSKASADSWPATMSAAAVVIEANSGELLFSANGDQALPPASTTKVISALVALDMCPDMDRSVTISAQAAAVGEMSIYLREGENLTVSDLLIGALVHSGNDAAYALGEAVAGSEPWFVHWMNMKAMVNGAYSANMKNTNGLPTQEHSISAEDLAVLSAKAMNNDLFAQVVSSKYAVLGEGLSYRRYQNTNKLLWHDERIVGVKTGTTDDAGPCLVAALRDGAALYISVVYNAIDRYGESMRLLDHAADSYMLACPIEAGDALAYWPQADSLLYACDTVRFLLPHNDLSKVKVRWELPYRVVFLDQTGKELGQSLLQAGI